MAATDESMHEWERYLSAGSMHLLPPEVSEKQVVRGHALASMPASNLSTHPGQPPSDHRHEHPRFYTHTQ